jgi:DNA-binding CsgD family transcriptional regulator
MLYPLKGDESVNDHYTIQQYIRKLEDASSHEELLYKIVEIYMELFPVLDSYFFRYSPLGYLAEGIILVNSTGIIHIREMRDDFRSLPIIHAAIRERKAKYCFGVEYLKQTNCKYIVSSNVNSLVVVPICLGSVVTGYFCSTVFSDSATIDDQTLSSMTLYGRLVGRVIESSKSTDGSILLSKRELEVMRRIAWGESIKEMADIMKISEVTIKQYVKSAIKKIGAQNRAQAIAELFRKGIIT